MHLEGEAAGKGVHEVRGNPCHASGPAPRAFLIFMKALAEQRMGVRDREPQVIIAQYELLDADAEASTVIRQQCQLGRHAAARGEPYLFRRRIKPESVAATGDRLPRHNRPIDNKMEVRIGGGRMAERRRSIE